MTHKCPKDGCGIDMPDHLLACRPHWYSIPRPVRYEITYAWKAFQKTSPVWKVFQKADRNDLQVRRLAQRRYVAARKAAIECLNEIT